MKIRISCLFVIGIAMICAGMFVFFSSASMITNGDMFENQITTFSEQPTEVLSDAVSADEANEMFTMDDKTLFLVHADNSTSTDSILKADDNKKEASIVEKIDLGMTYKQVISLIGYGTVSKNQSCLYPIEFLWDLEDGKTLGVTFKVNNYSYTEFVTKYHDLLSFPKGLDITSQEEYRKLRIQQWESIVDDLKVSSVIVF